MSKIERAEGAFSAAGAACGCDPEMEVFLVADLLDNLAGRAHQDVRDGLRARLRRRESALFIEGVDYESAARGGRRSITCRGLRQVASATRRSSPPCLE